MNKKKILVFGSSGLIGQSLVPILNKNFQVFPTHHNTKVHNNSAEIDILSTQSLKNIFNSVTPDIVINLCAIYNNLEFCEQNKKIVKAINGDILKDISLLCNDHSSHLVNFSTDYVFDGRSGNYNEHDPVSPINYYGISKAVGEKNIQKFSNHFSIIRTGMVYGTNKVKPTLPEWILEKITKNKPLEMISDQFMTPTYLDNLCNMIEEILLKNYTGIIHLAGTTKISRYDFAKKILTILKKPTDKLFPISSSQFDSNVCRPKDSSLNTSKAISLLTTKPEDFNSSIEKYFKNYSEYT
jgi:dTDP-4-dehydrorhamnose reductase